MDTRQLGTLAEFAELKRQVKASRIAQLVELTRSGTAVAKVARVRPPRGRLGDKHGSGSVYPRVGSPDRRLRRS